VIRWIFDLALLTIVAVFLRSHDSDTQSLATLVSRLKVSKYLLTWGS
jgi:hypothetical protein